MPRAIASLVFLGVFCASGLQAGAADDLAHKLMLMQSFSARFEQRVENEFGQALEDSSGMLHLRRPQAFLWQTYAPFPLIVSTSDTSVLVYDQDLAQVTELELDQVLAGTPAGIILTAGERLAGAFHVVESDASNPADIAFALTPVDDAAEFMRVEMVFDALGLLALDIEDALGNTTRVEFRDRRMNQSIADEVFEVDYPEGIDWVKR